MVKVTTKTKMAPERPIERMSAIQLAAARQQTLAGRPSTRARDYSITVNNLAPASATSVTPHMVRMKNAFLYFFVFLLFAGGLTAIIYVATDNESGSGEVSSGSGP